MLHYNDETVSKKWSISEIEKGMGKWKKMAIFYIPQLCSHMKAINCLTFDLMTFQCKTME